MRKVMVIGSVFGTVFALAGCTSKSGMVTTPSQPAPAAVTTGRISLNFDDGYTSAYVNAVPILERAGFHATFYIITRSVGVRGYMTQAEITGLAGRGHEIGAHTRTHPHMALLDVPQIRDEVIGCRQDLAAMGFPDVQTLAYPFGEYTGPIVSITQEAGFQAARSVDNGTNVAGVNRLTLKANPIGASESLPAVQHMIDAADTPGNWVILVFHRIDEDGNSISIRHELFTDIVDYISQKHLPVVTMQEGLRALP